MGRARRRRRRSRTARTRWTRPRHRPVAVRLRARDGAASSSTRTARRSRSSRPTAASSTTFTPNGDGVVGHDLDDRSRRTRPARSRSASPTTRTRPSGRSASPRPAATDAFTWDGKTYGGDDRAGRRVHDDDRPPATRSATAATGGRGPVRVVGLLGYVTNSTPGSIYPQDLDRFSKTTTLSFRLSRPATVTWTLRNAAGRVVLTHLDAVAARGRDPELGLRRPRPDRVDAPASGPTPRTSARRTGRSRSPRPSKVEMNAFSITTSVDDREARRRSSRHRDHRRVPEGQPAGLRHRAGHRHVGRHDDEGQQHDLARHAHPEEGRHRPGR